METRLKLLEQLTSYIKSQNTTKAYEIFNLLEETDNSEYQKENNLYLYLLSFISEVPNEYIQRINSIQCDDLLFNFNNSRYIDISTQNKIRISIFRAKFHETKELLKKEIELTETEKELLLTLINLANEKENFIRKQIEYLVKNKKYQELALFLEKRNKEKKLSLYEAYVYAITVSILRIIKTNKIPKVLNPNPENIKKAIMGYNFKMALIFNTKDLETKQEESKKIIHILLVEINKLIDNIIKEATQKLEKEKKLALDLLKGIKESLTKGNIELARKQVTEYLNYKNKEEYYYLVEKLIEICLINNKSYSEVLSFLEKINNTKYTFDMPYFYSQFHNSVSRNHFDIAKLYLDIIKYYQPQYKETMKDEELAKLIFSLENNLEEKDFLISELSTMEKENEHVKVLKKISQKRRKILIRIADDIEGLTATSIGIKEPKNLLLRRTFTKLKSENEKQIKEDALKLYNNKEYDKALLVYMRLLTSMEYASSKICEMIGLCYLHLNERQDALKYLNLSRQLQKKFLANRNGIDKIIELLEKVESKENDEKLELALTKYDSEVVNFSLEKIEELAVHMIENNITIEEGITKFELVPIQIQIIKLIFAKYHYIEGMSLTADKLLQEVEGSKPKPEPVVAMLNEVRNNKKIYENQNAGYTRKRTI